MEERVACDGLPQQWYCITSLMQQQLESRDTLPERAVSLGSHSVVEAGSPAEMK